MSRCDPTDILGKKFGRYVVSKIAPPKQNNQGWNLHTYEVVCVCGATNTVSRRALLSGQAKGCKRCGHTRHAKTHGHYVGDKPSPTHRSWRNMVNRCTNPKDIHYTNYGGRGITVTQGWMQFEGFLADMGERPEGTSLDRVDRDGPYNKENCRWATIKTQNRNKRTNVIIEINGESKCVAEWAESSGLPHALILSRYKRGWAGAALLLPPNRGQRYADVVI